MPAPTNVTALLATDLGTLPASISQNVHDAGVNYTVWYKFTAPADSVVVGIFGFGALGVGAYAPELKVYLGPAAIPVPYLILSATNVPVQIPVTPGTVYYLEFIKGNNNSPAVLLLEVEVAPNISAPSGSIFVNDDADGYPLALISPTVDNTVLRFVNPFPSGEGGDILPTGNILIDDIITSEVKLYSPSFVLLATLAIASTDSKIRANTALDKFYVGIETNPVTVKMVTAAGAFEATIYTLTANTTIKGIAANLAGTILYFSNNVNGSALKQWNLATDTAMADLVAGTGTYRIGDILVLTDGTLITLEFDATRTTRAVHYSAAGAVLHTYTFAVGAISTIPRIAYALDNPLSFWIWFHPTAGVSRFSNILISDGSIINSVDHVEYEEGIYQLSETATPVGRFGISHSCPFLILNVTAPVVTGYSGIYKMVGGKTFDELYDGDTETVDTKILDPMAQLYLNNDGS